MFALIPERYIDPCCQSSAELESCRFLPKGAIDAVKRAACNDGFLSWTHASKDTKVSISISWQAIEALLKDGVKDLEGHVGDSCHLCVSISCDMSQWAVMKI